MKKEYNVTHAKQDKSYHLKKDLDLQGHSNTIDANTQELEKWKQGVNTAIEDENYLALIKDLGSA